MCVLFNSVVIDMTALKLVSSELPLSRLLYHNWPNIAFKFKLTFPYTWNIKCIVDINRIFTYHLTRTGKRVLLTLQNIDLNKKAWYFFTLARDQHESSPWSREQRGKNRWLKLCSKYPIFSKSSWLYLSMHN